MKILYTGDYSKAPLTKAPLFVSRTLFLQLEDMGKDVIYLTYFQNGKKYDRLQKLFGFEVIDKERRIYRSGIFPYIFFIIKFKPDIIHLINFQLFYIVLFPLKKYIGAKLVYTAHGIRIYEAKHFLNIPNRRRMRILINEFLIMKFSDIIFVLSNLTGRFIRRYYNLQDIKIRTVPNGVNIPNEQKKYHEQIMTTLNAYCIGDINRSEKGYGFLFNVLKCTDTKIDITAFSTQVNYKLDIRIEEPVPNEILRKRIINYYLFITTSIYEPFSLALLEAMSCGLLFIASDRVGLVERFDEKLKKLVYKHNDENSFLEKINYISSLKYSDVLTLSSHIRNFAKNYSIENVCKLYLENYKKICRKTN